MMIKILQAVTVSMFALVAILGVILLLFATEKLAGYAQLVGIIFPLFVAEVIPALIGTPLTEAVRNLTAKKTPPAVTDGK